MLPSQRTDPHSTSADPREVAAPSTVNAPKSTVNAPKTRDPFFDNAKYLAIVLVAMGHSWEPLMGGSRTVQAAYMTVYAFHMPAFIIISGYFSRNFTGKPEQIKRLLTGVVVPYVVFETAYSLLQRWAGHDGHAISLTAPYYLTWFLASLFIWRLTTPIWRVVRWPLPLALVIAMLASMTPSIGKDFDLQRVLQFLPYFVLGLIMRREHFQRMRHKAVRIAALPVFACTLVFAYWAAPRMDSAWFYHRDAAQTLDAHWWAGPLMTLALFGCGLVLSACFFALVPGRTTWFSVLGAGTLYGYLLHGFVMKAAIYLNIYDAYPWLHHPLGEIACTVAAAIAVTLLCTAPFRKALRFVFEPRMAWAFRKAESKTA
jgi:fucose 4-O-acetylase-like acetyltransferase